MDKKYKIGIAPIGWTNDDMPDLGSNISFEQCISEMAKAGYVGTEIGNKYPNSPEVLMQALAEYNLEIANCWFSSFILTAPFAQVEREFRAKCAFLQACGAKRIGVSEQSYSIQGQMETAVFYNKYVMNDDEWLCFTTGLNALGKIAKEYNIKMTYHHHMGTVVQTEAEIDRMMQSTDSDSVFLLYDCGHLAYCDEDYLGVLAKYIDRIKHIHLKNTRPEVVAKVKAEKLSFLQGVRLGAFNIPCETGGVDFKKVFDIIKDSDYSGWLLVEAEQDPAIANPLEYATIAKLYINKILIRS